MKVFGLRAIFRSDPFLFNGPYGTLPGTPPNLWVLLFSQMKISFPFFSVPFISTFLPFPSFLDEKFL